MRVAVTWEMCGYIDVKATTMEEAKKIFNENPDVYKLPNGEYVDGSFRLTSEDVEEMKEMTLFSKKSKWSEIRNDYFNENEHLVYIDGWTTDECPDDAPEEGSVIAKVNYMTKEVEYLDEVARTDTYAQEVIQETLKNVGQYLLKVGELQRGSNGEILYLKKDYYGQGYIFKDEDAYRNRKNEPCYVPELSIEVYTGQNFLDLCEGQEEFADELFSEVDWQHPESLKEDWIANNEWVVCEKCGKLIDYGDGCNDKNCRYCGWSIKEDEKQIINIYCESFPKECTEQMELVTVIRGSDIVDLVIENEEPDDDSAGLNYVVYVSVNNETVERQVRPYNFSAMSIKEIVDTLCDFFEESEGE